MPVWSFEISDTATGATKAFVAAQGTRLTRRRAGASQIGYTVPPTDPAIAEIAVCERAVKASRKNVVRFYGQISDPLVIGSAGASVTASDPLYFLGDRRLQAELVYGATDLSDIGWNLIANENARSPTRIRRGATAPSVKADVVYPDGSVVSDLIGRLNARDQGIWFWIDPVDGVPGILGEYRTAWPDAGTFRPSAKFEFGAGTIGNLDDYSLQVGKPRNGARVTGASMGANIPIARRDDLVSRARYGLLEDDFSFTDVDDTTSLDQHALDKLQSSPPITITLTPKPYDPAASNDIWVPTLFDDFDAGDVVPILIRDEQFNFAGRGRIGEVTIAISDDGDSEQLEHLVVEVIA
jgi:hypothetical protein